MSTVFSQIVGAVIAALQVDPPVCATVYRARPNTVPDQVDQAVNVQFDQSLASTAVIRGGRVDWTSKVSIDCFARSMKDSGDVAVDPLLKAVYERLAQDTTLGGLIDDLNIAGIEAENTAEGKKTGWVRLTYIAQHSTENGSLSA